MADPLENESAETLLSMKNGAINFKSDTARRKESTSEIMEVDDDDEILVLNPASLGLKRVGDDEPATPKKTLKIRRQLSKPEKNEKTVNKQDNIDKEISNKPNLRQERSEKTNLRTQEKTEKTNIKTQEKTEKTIIKTQEKTEKPNLKEKIEKPNLKEKIEKPNLKEKIEKPNLKEKIEKPNLKEKIEKPNLKEKIEKTEKPNPKEKADKPITKEKIEKPILREKVEKPITKEKTDRPILREKVEKPITKEKTDRPNLREKTEKLAPKEKNDKQTSKDKTEKQIKQEKPEKQIIKQEKPEKQIIKQDKFSASSSTSSPMTRKSKSTKNSTPSSEKESEIISTPEQPLLNRRGMPARVRKKNRLFFDDDVIIETPFRAWPKKASVKTPTPTKRPSNLDVPSTSSKEKDEKKEKSTDNTSSIKTRSNSPATVTRSQTSSSSSSSSSNSISSIVTRRSQMTREERMKERAEREKEISSDIKTIALPSPSPSSMNTPEKKPIAKEIKIKTEKEDTKESKDDWTLMIPLSSPDRRAGQRIGMRLRNLLKLPKAHKWVCYEWFYSNIDKALFDGDNDFMNCLKESFPQLKTRTLTRVQWCKIRRMMGKPRRCSVAFFEEERRELERKRGKIRLLQQRKTSDVSNCKDLPGEIPLQLVIGTKVTARLRKPQDGLFTGSIDAVDTSNNTYRITFERQGLGTYSVPDYEVLSNEPPEMITLSSFAQKFRPRQVLAPYLMSAASGGFRRSGLLSGLTPTLNEQNRLNDLHPLTNLAPLLSGTSVEGQLGPFPIKFLEKIVRLNKILKEKREILNNLREMNGEAEKSNSFGWPILDEFKQRYALVVINLDELNHDMYNILDTIHKYCDEIEPESGLRQMLSTSHLREKSIDEARQVVNQVNMEGEFQISDERVLQLITQLTSLMIQVQNLSTEDRNTFEVQVLEESLSEIQRGLHPDNLHCFQDCVEVHIQHIQQSLGLGALNPFGSHRP